MNLPPYPKYKASGVEWLGRVPEHWRVDRLKLSTAGTINGIWGEEPNGVDDVICVRVADFDRDRFLVVDEPPTLRAVDPGHRRGRLLVKGDLLIEKSGGGEKQLVGCVVSFDHTFDAVCSNFVARMPVSAGHSSRFCVYAHASLYAGRVNYPAVKQTTGIQNLDASAYLSTLVAFPPPEEQLAIADFLDRETAKIDTLVAKKRTLIERLKEKRTALISQTVTRGLPPDAARAVGLDPHPKLKPSGIDWLGDVPEHWAPTRLRFISPHITVGIVVEPSKYYEDQGIPCLRSLNVHPNSLVDSDLVYISRESHRMLSKSMVKQGDLVAVRSGQPGTTAVIDERFDRANCIDLIIIRRPRIGVPTFFSYFLNSLPAQAQFSRGAGGAIQQHFNITTASDLWLVEPPEYEQAAIADFLDRETAKIDGMTEKVETAIERLQEYRAALITAAVTGKIDVRARTAHNLTEPEKSGHG
jgi:type I restriction enzyme S subunit